MAERVSCCLLALMMVKPVEGSHHCVPSVALTGRESAAAEFTQ